ncbi:MAG TPA: aminotransferase [Ruminococcaceae bacterium]|nr:aminotransferase [Oscillospiraceae bacterium]
MALLSKEQLRLMLSENLEKHAAYKAKGLKLDMSRGKPSVSQLDLCGDMLVNVSEESGVKSGDGTDTRNYGMPEGLPEIKNLFARILELPAENVLVGGNSSLNLMFDVFAQAMSVGMPGCEPWAKQGKIKFICPVPGYDRHFSVCEYFGIEMINVEMTPNGPDMDAVEKLAADGSVKGMWCVPKYSNPDGCVYSDETVRRIASLKPAAKDFRVFWDNAYCMHDLYDTSEPLLPIFKACLEAGNPEMVIQFASTSKISFAGAGVSAVAAGDENIRHIKKRLFIQTIGHDKINQLRHARRFPDIDVVKAHMKRHAAIIRPKFELLYGLFTREFGGNGLISWTEPKGGYFMSVDVMEGCAKRVAGLCADAGVVLTPAGATYPYGKDPRDRNIRIAPTVPPIEELEQAAEIFCVAVKIASAEKLLGR